MEESLRAAVSELLTPDRRKEFLISSCSLRNRTCNLDQRTSCKGTYTGRVDRILVRKLQLLRLQSEGEPATLKAAVDDCYNAILCTTADALSLEICPEGLEGGFRKP
ncbi:unnamed protein product [Sphagnum jensenii]|uniref:Uncharacterized protein n=1 Tax=Sphagnum jensenii TaxID=128206 RepID=A0ABP1AY99_9BRYO